MGRVETPPFEEMREAAGHLGRQVADKFGRLVDDVAAGKGGGSGDIIAVVRDIKGNDAGNYGIAEVGHFADSLETWLGNDEKGIIGYLFTVHVGLQSYQLAVNVAADAYDAQEKWSQKQLDKIDISTLGQMGISYTFATTDEKQPDYSREIVVNNNLLKEVDRSDYDARGELVKSDWYYHPSRKFSLKDVEWLYRALMSPQQGSASDVAQRLSAFGDALRIYQGKLWSHAQNDLVGWTGIAARQYSMLVDQARESMGRWSVELMLLAGRVSVVADKIGEVKGYAQAWYDWCIAEASKYPENDDRHVDVTTKAARSLMDVGKWLSDALAENTRWNRPGPYEGLLMREGLANRRRGDSLRPGNLPKGGPGPGGGPGGGPTAPPGGPKQNPNANPNPPSSNLPKPALPNPNLPKPTVPKLNPNQIPNPNQTPKLATPQLPTPSLGANPLAGSLPQLPGGPTAMPAGVPELPSPSLPGANDLPGLSGPGATPLTPGVIPTLPGRSPTSPDVPSLTGRPRTPSSLSANPGGGGGVTLPGRGGGVTGPGPGGNDQTTYLPVAANGTDPETPLAVGPKAANVGPGGDGGGGGMPFMPPMGGMNPGAAGSGGGGQPPRAVRRGGPRLVDQDTGNGPSALSGRSRDQRRDQPKVVKVETESWTPEQEPAQAPRQQQVRPTPGAV